MGIGNSENSDFDLDNFIQELKSLCGGYSGDVSTDPVSVKGNDWLTACLDSVDVAFFQFPGESLITQIHQDMVAFSSRITKGRREEGALPPTMSEIDTANSLLSRLIIVLENMK
ncbi:MAG: hypothetical protein UT55_C0051G0012 [Candidatus Peregrinibacteria bacterium GW2011_GWE2_39_6]|nr:MAG: hypothetical protein UT36_C0012G0007 [Candidatus Peregrinibacteria bacterium GW2011_GWF2_39_17]KKR24952.1 MAG: hypothetical protein UT55_C0051G0012 [Candidatus Peregrinibacteria bacterium GW2011_GWE2_39_6]